MSGGWASGPASGADGWSDADDDDDAEPGDDDAGDDDDDTPRLDLPLPDDDDDDAADGGADDDGCTKVDLLFVIDGSISMDVAQDKLGSATDAFVAAIQTQLVDAADFHIGVVTSTEYSHNRVGCAAPGSLISQTGGEGSSGSDCGPFAQGGAWVSPDDEGLPDKLACIAGIGLGNGNVELTAQATVQAITSDGPAGCNAGFVRDDALLVIVTVTDTDDPSSYPPGQGSSGDPDGWFTAITAAKGGLETNVVMVSIIPPDEPTCTVEGNWSPLLPGPLDAPRLDELARKFTYHHVGDVCAADYGLLLGDALADVAAACEEFTPVG